MLQLIHYLCCPCLHSSTYMAPVQHRLQVQTWAPYSTCVCWVKKKDYHPQPADKAQPNSPGGCWLSPQGHTAGSYSTLSARILSLLCQAAFQLMGPQSVLMHVVVPPQVQDLLFHFLELHEIAVGHLYSLWMYLQTITNLPDVLGVSHVHDNTAWRFRTTTTTK